jgi:hypothetical protein
MEAPQSHDGEFPNEKHATATPSSTWRPTRVDRRPKPSGDINRNEVSSMEA